jgi:hypothetical protein
MVRYYGRARQRTGSVNRNQPGLKMQGTLSRTGALISSWRIHQTRVNGNARVGCVDSHGRPTGQRRVLDKVTLQPRCVSNGTASNPRYLLIPQAPRSRGCAGGVYMLQHNVKCR